MTRKDIQFITICVGAVALAFIVVHLLWPPAEPEPEVSITQGIAALYPYVASVNSEVFHERDCKFVKRIKQENMIGFESREKAVETGRRACKICKP